MNVLFISLLDFNSLEERNIYTDLLREFRKYNHKIYAISPIERRNCGESKIIHEENCIILKLRIGNIQKTNIFEKGISTITIGNQLVKGIRKYFSDVKFDLVIYPTPPITIVDAIDFVKKRDNAKSYLLLKDIFPQNAVDLGMMSKSGVKGFIYKSFRQKEKKLYKISDYIGCMSQANVDYLLKHNSEINPKIVEICPNSVDIIDMSVDFETSKEIRKKYDLPLDKKIFIYGGNLGKPQGIDFMIECLKKQESNKSIFFLIVGDGTEFTKIEKYILDDRPANVRLMKSLPKKDYDKVVAACDIGMIFLDYRFTIPNFPSRLLSYIQAKIPVLAVTDCNTDIGEVIVNNNIGCWCESNNVDNFTSALESILQLENANFDKLAKEYSTKNSYEIIMNSVISRENRVL